MQIHIMASGSSGNATFVEFEDSKLLIDTGISNKRIEMGLAEIGVRPSELDGVLITHEHSDHIKGLDVFSRKHQIPVYARPLTWKKITCRDKIPQHCRHIIEDEIEIGKLKIQAFNTSHDAIDPVGFCIKYEDCKLTFATDLGVVTPEVEEAVAYSDFLILEANHDLQMLIDGTYPFYLKQRIRSKLGHLSNHDTAKLLASTPRKSNMQVFLAHLSQHNNHPALAEKTVANVLQYFGFNLGEDIILHRTYQNSLASYIK